MTLTTLLDTAAGWPAPAVLAVAAALLVVESGTPAGVLLPGTSLLLGLGLWSQAVGVTPAAVAAAAAAGTVLGAHLSWWRGRCRVGHGGPASLGRRLAPVTGWLRARGSVTGAAVLAAGHWASAARSVVPWVAGRAGVRYRLAGPVLTLTGSAWAATLVLLGSRAGPYLAGRAGWAAPALLVAALGLLSWRTHRKRPLAGIAGACVGGAT